MSVKLLREKRAEVYKELRRLADLNNDEKHTWTAEDQQNWDKVNKDFDALGEKLERAERADKLGEMLSEPAGDPRIGREDRDWGKDTEGAGEIEDAEDLDPEAIERGQEEDDVFAGKKNRISARSMEDFALAFQGWARYGRRELTKRHIDACRRTRLDPRRSYIDLPLRSGNPEEWTKLVGGVGIGPLRRELRAQSTSSTAGGEFIPEGFVNQLEISLLAFGGMRVKSEILRTATGNALPWPTTNDTSNTGELLAENTGAAEQDIVTAAVTFNAYKYSSKLVKVSVELLEDSAFDLASVLGRLLGERIGRITNSHFTTGDGSGKPRGIVTAAGTGVTLANSTTNVTTFTAPTGSDGFITLIHSVDPAYRSSPGVGFMMHDTTLREARKLKDSQNRYLFRFDETSGIPTSLLGYPIVINQDMAVPAASAKTVVFGDLSKYKIRDVAGFRLRRLVERYAEADQEAFVAFSRHDGDLLDAGTDPVKLLVMAAT